MISDYILLYLQQPLMRIEKRKKAEFILEKNIRLAASNDHGIS